jgi:hypothetical protein
MSNDRSLPGPLATEMKEVYVDHDGDFGKPTLGEADVLPRA